MATTATNVPSISANLASTIKGIRIDSLSLQLEEAQLLLRARQLLMQFNLLMEYLHHELKIKAVASTNVTLLMHCNSSCARPALLPMAHSVSEQTRRRLNVLLSRVKSCCESLESVRLDLTKQASLNQRVAEALEQAGLAEVHHLAQQKYNTASMELNISDMIQSLLKGEFDEEGGSLGDVDAGSSAAIPQSIHSASDSGGSGVNYSNGDGGGEGKWDDANESGEATTDQSIKLGNNAPSSSPSSLQESAQKRPKRNPTIHDDDHDA